MSTSNDPHAAHWGALAAAAETIGALCTTEQARELCAAIDRLSDAIMRHEPIDMVLHCPACGEQHVDAPEPSVEHDHGAVEFPAWDNPPHRSHLCHGCGHIWRPADVATNGVREIKTQGKNDSVRRS